MKLLNFDNYWKYFQIFKFAQNFRRENQYIETSKFWNLEWELCNSYFLILFDTDRDECKVLCIEIELNRGETTHRLKKKMWKIATWQDEKINCIDLWNQYLVEKVQCCEFMCVCVWVNYKRRRNWRDMFATLKRCQWHIAASSSSSFFQFHFNSGLHFFLKLFNIDLLLAFKVCEWVTHIKKDSIKNSLLLYPFSPSSSISKKRIETRGKNVINPDIDEKNFRILFSIRTEQDELEEEKVLHSVQEHGCDYDNINHDHEKLSLCRT